MADNLQLDRTHRPGRYCHRSEARYLIACIKRNVETFFHFGNEHVYRYKDYVLVEGTQVVILKSAQVIYSSYPPIYNDEWRKGHRGFTGWLVSKMVLV